MGRHELALAASILLTPLSQVLLRSGAKKTASMFNITTAVSYGIFALVAVLTVYALQTLSLRSVTAWNSLAYVLTPLAGHFLLKDEVTTRALFGAAIIVVGIGIFFL